MTADTSYSSQLPTASRLVMHMGLSSLSMMQADFWSSVSTQKQTPSTPAHLPASYNASTQSHTQYLTVANCPSQCTHTQLPRLFHSKENCCASDSQHCEARVGANLHSAQRTVVN